MHISGERPTRVVALAGAQSLPGYPTGKRGGMGGVAPSLINMSNGAVVRNFMGATTNDAGIYRYWGTRGSAEIDHGLYLRLGASGGAPKMAVNADWGELTPLAEKMGHGGGDFFVLYYFARQILFGKPAPFDLYRAADVTIPGILAYRSAVKGGKTYEVPDFRKKADRDAWRGDHFAQPRHYNDKGCFPQRADQRLTGQFTSIMKDLIYHALEYRAYADWSRVFDDVTEPAKVVELADGVIRRYPAMRRAMTEARKLADAYPRSDGAKVLREMLAVGDEATVMRPDFLDALKKKRARLKRKLRRSSRFERAGHERVLTTCSAPEDNMR